MEREYEYFLHLLGAFIREEAPVCREGADWDVLMQLGDIHSVSGILGYMTRKYPICPDAEKAAALRMLCRNTVAVYLQRAAHAEDLTRELEAAGIDHILMKGYVLRELYPMPELRTFNDIDILIRCGDREKCDGRMMALGFLRHTDWEPVYSYVRGRELYEIHTRLVDADQVNGVDLNDSFRDLWTHTRMIRPHSYRFTKEFHFLYMLAHIAKHVSGAGAGARMYLDAAAYLRHYGGEMDWQWVFARLADMGLTDFSATVLSAVESWFGVACPAEYEKCPAGILTRFRDFTLEAGVFGHHQRSEAVTDLKNSDQSRLARAVQRAFPDVRALRERYTYLQSKPWLLPVAWVHRLALNREKLGDQTRRMQDILLADNDEVRRMKKLMRDIGL